MQFTEAQKAGITQMHAMYVTNLAQIATRRQQLLQQLQDAPQPQGLHFEELAACHEQLDDVTQKLQMCALDENQLLLYQQASLAVKVHISACVRQNLNLSLRPTLRGSAHLVALGLLSMMLLCMIVKPVGLVDRIRMLRTDCFGKTRLVPHVPSSS